MKFDSLEDRMKYYERQGQLTPLLPACARLDGKNFSSFTRNFSRPFDPRISYAMMKVTKFLVESTCANIGYTQSDEITLLWFSDNTLRQIFYDGKTSKMIGDLAVLATLSFQALLRDECRDCVEPGAEPRCTGRIPLNVELESAFDEVDRASAIPRFDARVWNVPTKAEAVNVFVWREQDATRNSISMAARAIFSHNELKNKSCKEMQEMLWQKGINWNDYPAFFKRGSYFQRRVVSTKFSAEEIEKLPEKHEARSNPDLQVERNVVVNLDMLPILQVGNREAVIFYGVEPFVATEK